MIRLIGHGYVGSAIAWELTVSRIPFIWNKHTDTAVDNVSCIINAGGYTGSPNVDACEYNKNLTLDGNCVWPVTLEAKFPNIPIVHVSSGCVYTGYKTGGYTEEDEPNFNFENGSWYSGTKALAEKLLKPYLHKSYLLRIRMPFGLAKHPKNLLTKLETYNKLVDFENSLSYVPDVAKVAVFFATEQPTFGCYNLCNPGSITTRKIADMMGLQKEWFTHDEFNQAVKAPRSNCVLNTDKLEKIYPIKPLDQVLNFAISQYKATA